MGVIIFMIYTEDVFKGIGIGITASLGNDVQDLFGAIAKYNFLNNKGLYEALVRAHKYSNSVSALDELKDHLENDYVDEHLPLEKIHSFVITRKNIAKQVDEYISRHVGNDMSQFFEEAKSAIEGSWKPEESNYRPKSDDD